MPAIDVANIAIPVNSKATCSIKTETTHGKSDAKSSLHSGSNAPANVNLANNGCANASDPRPSGSILTHTESAVVDSNNNNITEPSRTPIQGIVNHGFSNCLGSSATGNILNSSPNRSPGIRHNAATSTMRNATGVQFPLGGAAWNLHEILNSWDSDYSDMDD